MLTLNWVGSLRVRSEVDVSTHRYVVSEKIPVTTKAFLILHLFFAKNLHFYSTFTQSNSVRLMLEIF